MDHGGNCTGRVQIGLKDRITITLLHVESRAELDYFSKIEYDVLKHKNSGKHQNFVFYSENKNLKDSSPKILEII